MRATASAHESYEAWREGEHDDLVLALACAATAHKLARLVYRMLKYGRDYVKQGMDEYAAKMRTTAERSLRKKAAVLGFELTLRTAAATH